MERSLAELLEDAARILGDNCAPCPVKRRDGAFVYLTAEHLRAIKQAARIARKAEEGGPTGKVSGS